MADEFETFADKNIPFNNSTSNNNNLSISNPILQLDNKKKINPYNKNTNENTNELGIKVNEVFDDSYNNKNTSAKYKNVVINNNEKFENNNTPYSFNLHSNRSKKTSSSNIKSSQNNNRYEPEMLNKINNIKFDENDNNNINESLKKSFTRKDSSHSINSRISKLSNTSKNYKDRENSSIPKILTLEDEPNHKSSFKQCRDKNEKKDSLLNNKKHMDDSIVDTNLLTYNKPLSKNNSNKMIIQNYTNPQIPQKYIKQVSNKKLRADSLSSAHTKQVETTNKINTDAFNNSIIFHTKNENTGDIYLKINDENTHRTNKSFPINNSLIKSNISLKESNEIVKNKEKLNIEQNRIKIDKEEIVLKMENDNLDNLEKLRKTFLDKINLLEKDHNREITSLESRYNDYIINLIQANNLKSKKISLIDNAKEEELIKKLDQIKDNKYHQSISLKYKEIIEIEKKKIEIIEKIRDNNGNSDLNINDQIIESLKNSIKEIDDVIKTINKKKHSDSYDNYSVLINILKSREIDLQVLSAKNKFSIVKGKIGSVCNELYLEINKLKNKLLHNKQNKIESLKIEIDNFGNFELPSVPSLFIKEDFLNLKLELEESKLSKNYPLKEIKEKQELRISREQNSNGTSKNNYNKSLYNVNFNSNNLEHIENNNKDDDLFSENNSNNIFFARKDIINTNNTNHSKYSNDRNNNLDGNSEKNDRKIYTNYKNSNINNNYKNNDLSNYNPNNDIEETEILNSKKELNVMNKANNNCNIDTISKFSNTILTNNNYNNQMNFNNTNYNSNNNSTVKKNELDVSNNNRSKISHNRSK